MRPTLTSVILLSLSTDTILFETPIVGLNSPISKVGFIIPVFLLLRDSVEFQVEDRKVVWEM